MEGHRDVSHGAGAGVSGGRVSKPRAALPADRLREECGVFGIWGAENAARLT
jgi:hypothetical protein